jgi:hypothetical protein
MQKYKWVLKEQVLKRNNFFLNLIILLNFYKIKNIFKELLQLENLSKEYLI